MRVMFFNTNQPVFDLHTTIYGNEDCTPGFVCPLHIRPYYLIHYVIRGEGFLRTEHGVFRASEGQIFVIFPNHPVSYDSPDPEKTWSFCWIGFDGKGADLFVKQLGLSFDNPVLTMQDHRFMTAVLSMIDETQRQKSLSELQCYAHLLNALAAIDTSLHKKQKTAPRYTERAVAFIENNYMRHITVQDLADHLQLERSYLYRVFKKETRVSPEQYLLRYRIERAVELLIQSNYSCEQIAMSVGFCDVFHFSKIFKKNIGVSPSAYRQSHAVGSG